MNTNKKLTLTYQFCSVYYSNFYGMLAKIQEFLEHYEILVQTQHRYVINPFHAATKDADEIVLGEIIPPFLPNPIILEYEINEGDNLKSFSKKIHHELLDILGNKPYPSEGRIVVRIKHQWI